MYHRQQNKWYPLQVFFAFFNAIQFLAVANSLAHNNISQICYCDQISLQSAAVNCSFSDNLTPLGVPFILLAMVRHSSHEDKAHDDYRNEFHGKIILHE